MPSYNEISAINLMRLISTPDCPVILDVRDYDDSAVDPRRLPTAVPVAYQSAMDMASGFMSGSVWSWPARKA